MVFNNWNRKMKSTLTCSSVSTTSSWLFFFYILCHLWCLPFKGLQLAVLGFLNRSTKLICGQLKRALVPTSEECFPSGGVSPLYSFIQYILKLNFFPVPAPGLSTLEMKGKGQPRTEDERLWRAGNIIHHHFEGFFLSLFQPRSIICFCGVSQSQSKWKQQQV